MTVCSIALPRCVRPIERTRWDSHSISAGLWAHGRSSSRKTFASSPTRRRAPSGIEAPISPKRSRIAASAIRRAISRSRSNNRKNFAGAVTAGWHAFNISSDRGSGIGAWNDKEVTAYLATGHATGRGTAAGPMGEAVDQSFSLLAPADIKALVVYLHSVPAVASSEPGTIAPPAPPLPKQGGETADILGRRVFEGACVSCHNWTGVSAISPYATIAGTRAVNDPHATNVAQIVISGTTRQMPPGVLSMPAFGGIYSDAEIAAVANYVTQRFGNERATISDKDVAALRNQTSH